MTWKLNHLPQRPKRMEIQKVLFMGMETVIFVPGMLIVPTYVPLVALFAIQKPVLHKEGIRVVVHVFGHVLIRVRVRVLQHVVFPATVHVTLYARRFKHLNVGNKQQDNA